MIEMELYAFVYRFAGNGMANHAMGGMIIMELNNG